MLKPQIKNLNYVGRTSTSIDEQNMKFSKILKIITGKSPKNYKNPKASDWKNVNFIKSAEKYLKGGGMTENEIAILKKNLSINR